MCDLKYSPLLPYNKKEFRIYFLNAPKFKNDLSVKEKIKSILSINYKHYENNLYSSFLILSLHGFKEKNGNKIHGIHAKFNFDKTSIDFLLNFDNFSIFYKYNNGKNDQVDDIVRKIILDFLNYIVDNYDFDRIKEEEISMFDPFLLENVCFKNFNLKLPIIKNLDEIICSFGPVNISQLLVFEKMCRYLEYGKENYNKFQTLWSEFYIKKECLNLNLDFNAIVDKFLCDNVTSELLNEISRSSYELDDKFIQGKIHYARYEEHIHVSRFSEDNFSDKILNLDYSPSTNSRIVKTLLDFHYLFLLYAKITEINCMGDVIPCKYIYVPKKACYLWFDCANITQNLYDNLLFYKKHLCNSVFYRIDNKIFALMMHTF